MSFSQKFTSGRRGDAQAPDATTVAHDRAEAAVRAALAPLTRALESLDEAAGRSVALSWQRRSFLGYVHVTLAIHYDTPRGHGRKPAPDILLSPVRDRKPHPSVTVEAVCEQNGHPCRWTVQDNNTLSRQEIGDSVFFSGGGRPRDGRALHPVTVKTDTPETPAAALGAALGRLMPVHMPEIEKRLMAEEAPPPQSAPADRPAGPPAHPAVPPANPRLKL
jgi:hypothetical protein